MVYTTPYLEWIEVLQDETRDCIYSSKCSVKANDLKHFDIHSIGTRSISGGSVTKMKKFEC